MQNPGKRKKRKEKKNNGSLWMKTFTTYYYTFTHHRYLYITLKCLFQVNWLVNKHFCYKKKKKRLRDCSFRFSKCDLLISIFISSDFLSESYNWCIFKKLFLMQSINFLIKEIIEQFLSNCHKLQDFLSLKQLKSKCSATGNGHK